MSYTHIKKIDSNYSNDLAGQVLKFIDEACTDLRFDFAITEKEKTEGFKGTSISKNQIPYNMQMDIDRLCLSNAVKRFLKSGKKEDAFDVYFCYIEMFIGGYENSRRMIELLSEFEENGSGLLMKHRDHYSHSVYVFLIGLAIYESNSKYREAFKNFYGITASDKKEEEMKAAHNFIKYWGLTSLFHDIGYPFELPFEQVASYFEVEGDKRKDKPYVAYNDLDKVLKLSDKINNQLSKILNNKCFSDTNSLFAYLLTEKLGETYNFTFEEMKSTLIKKPVAPNEFGHYMDHAYFSCNVLFYKLFTELELKINKEYLDALTAILLHNSLYKFSVAHYKYAGNIPFDVNLHPLAFMLMICDELQCWDRTAYGRNSKLELHPMGCEFDFSNEEIKATYLFDEKESGKINQYIKKYDDWITLKPKTNDEKLYKEWKDKKPEKLKAFSSMYNKNDKGVNEFQEDIELIVNLKEIKVNVDYKIIINDFKDRRTYLSDSNFINLYNFAVILNAKYSYSDMKSADETGKLEEYILDSKNFSAFVEMFNNLSLEYKLSNINQAKSFEYYLDKIGCFYTDKAVDFEMVEELNEKQLLLIGPMEHKRWLEEHYEMGWVYGEPKDKNERENKRIHKDMIENYTYNGEVSDEDAEKHYKELNKAEQDKDTEPMKYMLLMLKMFDGLRIYKYKDI